MAGTQKNGFVSISAEYKHIAIRYATDTKPRSFSSLPFYALCFIIMAGIFSEIVFVELASLYIYAYIDCMLVCWFFITFHRFVILNEMLHTYEIQYAFFVVASVEFVATYTQIYNVYT